MLGLVLSAQSYSQTISSPDSTTNMNTGIEIAMSLVDTSYYDAEYDEYWKEFSSDWQTAYYIMNYLTVDDSMGCEVWTGKRYIRYVKKEARKGVWEYKKEFDTEVMDYCLCENEHFTMFIYVFKDGNAYGAIVN